MRYRGLALLILASTVTAWTASAQPLALDESKRWLAIADGGTVRIWDTAYNKEFLRFDTEMDTVSILAWSGSGRWLASAGGNRLRVWDTARWTRRFPYSSPASDITALAWKGDMLAWGEEDGNIGLWTHQKDGQEGLESTGADGVTALAWSSERPWLAVGTSTGKVGVADMERHSYLWQNSGHGAPTRALIWLSGRQQLVSGAEDDKLVKWVAPTGRQIGTRFIPQDVLAMAWHPKQGLLDIGGSNGVTLLEGSKEITALAPRAQITLLSWRSGASRLYTAGPEGDVRLYTLREFREDRPPQASESAQVIQVRALSWSEDETLLAIGALDGMVYTWNVQDGAKRLLISHVLAVRSLAWAKKGYAQGYWLASADEGGFVRLWRDEEDIEGLSLRRGDRNGEWCSIKWQGRFLLSAGKKGLQAWDIKQGEPVLAPLVNRPHPMACTGNGKIQIWDASESTNRTASANVKAQGQGVALGQDQAAWADMNGNLWLWKYKTELAPVQLQNVQNASAVAWSHDGRWLAVGYRDGLVQVLDIKTLKSTRWDAFRPPVEGPYAEQTKIPVTALAFNKSSSLIASGSDNGITLWKQPKRPEVKQAIQAKQPPLIEAADAGTPDAVAVASSPSPQSPSSPERLAEALSPLPLNLDAGIPDAVAAAPRSPHNPVEFIEASAAPTEWGLKRYIEAQKMFEQVLKAIAVLLGLMLIVSGALGQGFRTLFRAARRRAWPSPEERATQQQRRRAEKDAASDKAHAIKSLALHFEGEIVEGLTEGPFQAIHLPRLRWGIPGDFPKHLWVAVVDDEPERKIVQSTLTQPRTWGVALVIDRSSRPRAQFGPTGSRKEPLPLKEARLNEFNLTQKELQDLLAAKVPSSFLLRQILESYSVPMNLLSPYRLGGWNPGMFFGRDNELSTLIDTVTAYTNCALIGPPQVGKTWLLKGLAQRLATQGNHQWEAEYIRLIGNESLERLWEKIRLRQGETAPLQRKVFLIDDADELLLAVVTSSPNPTARALVTTMLELAKQKKCCFLLAGRGRAGHARDLAGSFNGFAKVGLGGLSLEAASQLLRLPMEELGLAWATPEDRTHLVDQTGARPALLTLACSGLIRRMTHARRHVISRDMVDTVLKEDFQANHWRSYHPLINIMVAYALSGKSWAADMQNAIERESIRLSNANFEEAVAWCQMSGLLEFKTVVRSPLHCPVPLMEKHLKEVSSSWLTKDLKLLRDMINHNRGELKWS